MVYKWGSAAAVSSTFVDVTFPVPFPAACDIVIPSIPLGGDAVQAVTVENVSASGFRVRWAAQSTFTVFWRAVGR